MKFLGFLLVFFALAVMGCGESSRKQKIKVSDRGTSTTNSTNLKAFTKDGKKTCLNIETIFNGIEKKKNTLVRSYISDVRIFEKGELISLNTSAVENSNAHKNLVADLIKDELDPAYEKTFGNNVFKISDIRKVSQTKCDEVNISVKHPTSNDEFVSIAYTIDEKDSRGPVLRLNPKNGSTFPRIFKLSAANKLVQQVFWQAKLRLECSDDVTDGQPIMIERTLEWDYKQDMDISEFLGHTLRSISGDYVEDLDQVEKVKDAHKNRKRIKVNGDAYEYLINEIAELDNSKICK